MDFFLRGRWAVSFFFLILTFSFNAFSAEVYYLGDMDSGTGSENRDYSLKERIADLFDFSSKRPFAERSGIISGNVITQVEWDRVGGNEAKSFLEDGWNYSTDLALRIREKLPGTYNMEGELRLRKTDDSNIEKRRDVRIKQYSLKVSNPRNLFLFGDFYGDFSPFTLSSSLEGFTAETRPLSFLSMKQVIARRYSADEVSAKFQRNVFGAKLDFDLARDSQVFSVMRFGVQAVTSQDDSSTCANASAEDLQNTVVSFDGDISFIRGLSINYEIARSAYLEDEDSASSKDKDYGNAMHIATQFQAGRALLRHTYNYGQPDFYSDSGSAFRDRAQHLLTLDYRINDRATVSFMENYYWDMLRGSSLDKRTTNNEQGITLNFRPLRDRDSLRMRINTSFNSRNSNDAANSLESDTFVLGWSASDNIGDADVGLSYEYRAFDDEGDNSLSEYFHRVGVSLAREYHPFGKRLYLSFSPNLDIRKSKTDPDRDVNLSISFSGQYGLSQSVLARFGCNMVDSNNAGPGSNYTNNRTFLELDWTVDEEKDGHIILKGETSRYSNEDSSQDYKESRIILKCVYNF